MSAAGDDPAGGGFVALYTCEATRALNAQYGDLLYRLQDLEVRYNGKEGRVLRGVGCARC
jgi:hypothetical protein